jgi:hypothetical protein
MNRFLARRCPPARHGFKREPQIFRRLMVSPGLGGKVGAGRVCVHGGNGYRKPMIEWEASATWRIVSPGWTFGGR